jgi:hypothetical protein
MKRWAVATAPLLMFLSACATTSIRSQWHPSFRTKGYQKLAVCFNFADLGARQSGESYLIAALPRRARQLVPGSALLFPGMSAEEVGAIVSSQGIDGILVVSPVGSGMSSTYLPKTTSTQGSARISGNTIYGSSTTWTYGGFNINKPWANYKAELIDMQTGRVVWFSFAKSAGNAFASWNDLLASMAKETAKQLERDGVLGPLRRVPVRAVQTQPARPLAGQSRRETVTRAAEPDPATMGGLRLYVAPWARVEVDGAPVGTTPFGALTLAAGTHEVRLTHPDHEPLIRTVTVVAGQTAELEVDFAGGTAQREVERHSPEPVAAGPEAALAEDREACEQGDAGACLDLADAYWLGKGVAEAPALAVALFREACRAENTAACLRLGLAHQQGRGVTQDDERAANLFEQVCESGEAQGCALLGSAYWLGRGVDKDRDRAGALFAQACAGGIASACERSE